MFDPNPTVRGQELGEQLRALRDRSGLSLRDAAECMDASASKLSRIETGRKNAPVEDIGALLAIYDVRGAQRRELLALAREAERRGWWQRDRSTFPERQRTLISLESRADHIVTFETVVIPGLLQTSDYTRALMEESGLVPDDQVNDHMVTRASRQSLLMRRDPPTLSVITHELALHQMVGGAEVLLDQLDYLVEQSYRPHVSIRILPNIGGHAGAIGAFTLLRQRCGPSVVFLENLTSSLFLEERQEIETYQKAVRTLSSRCLDERESRELIAALAAENRAKETTDAGSVEYAARLAQE